jgi:hypothetical protein
MTRDLWAFGLMLAALGCSSGSSTGAISHADAGLDAKSDRQDVDASRHDAAHAGDVVHRADVVSADAGAPPDAGKTAISLTCAVSSSPPSPNPCPAVHGVSGMATFCYRPQWSGVTAVEVYGGFGQATDWTDAFLTLTNDGSGTFTGTTALADGTYPYVFKAQGTADNLVPQNHPFLDQYNTAFVPAPAGAPDQRSVSSLTVPQPASPAVVHITGKVVWNGAPQSCYSIDLEAGENLMGSMVISEHDTANYAESANDGTFDFPVAVGAQQYGITIRFPFLLSGATAAYPDPSTTPSVGTIRTTITPTADLALDRANIAYAESAYAAMSPTGGTATLPVTFTFTVTAGANDAWAAVIGTDIAGNDPAYTSTAGTATSTVWNGAFNGSSGNVVLGTKYYWGAWERTNPLEDGGTTWTAESLLFPITFH